MKTNKVVVGAQLPVGKVITLSNLQATFTHIASPTKQVAWFKITGDSNSVNYEFQLFCSFDEKGDMTVPFALEHMLKQLELSKVYDDTDDIVADINASSKPVQVLATEGINKETQKPTGFINYEFNPAAILKAIKDGTATPVAAAPTKKKK